MVGRGIFKLNVLLAGFLLISLAAKPCQSETLKATVEAVTGFSGIVVRLHPDGKIESVATGLADRSPNRVHALDEVWPWASVTKQVTAVFIMQEVERGRLKLEAPITDYLPDFKGEKGRQISLRQLLQHTSGLPNPADTPVSAEDVPSFYLQTGPQISAEARVDGFCAGKPAAARNGHFNYNNCDYLVLEAILQAVTRKTYAQLVDERLVKPLGLTSLHIAPDMLGQGSSKIKGYDLKGNLSSAMNIATLGAGGALMGSASDMIRFDAALMSGKLLKPESLRVLWLGDPKLGYQALGVWSFPAKLRGCVATVDLIERRGDFAGIQVRNIIAPELRQAIVIFTNISDLEFGEIWQAQGLSYDLLSRTFCEA